MKTTHTSVFNLIDIFRRSTRKIVHTISSKTDCSTHFLNDFYCDAERPHISNQ